MDTLRTLRSVLLTGLVALSLGLSLAPRAAAGSAGVRADVVTVAETGPSNGEETHG